MPRLRSGRKIRSGDLVQTIDETSLKSSTVTEVEIVDSHNEKHSTVDNTVEESDDEAPESIALSTSKDAAIAKRQDEKEAIDAMKEKEKQKRKQKEETLKKQKEIRENRENSRISNSILFKVAEKQKEVAKKQEVQQSNIHKTFGEDDDDSADDNDVDDEIEKEETNAGKKGLQLVVMNQTKKRNPEVMNSANEFLRNHFYGDRLNRVDTLKDENIKRRKKHFGPAIKFMKKS